MSSAYFPDVVRIVIGLNIIALSFDHWGLEADSWPASLAIPPPTMPQGFSTSGGLAPLQGMVPPFGLLSVPLTPANVYDALLFGFNLFFYLEAVRWVEA